MSILIFNFTVIADIIIVIITIVLLLIIIIIIITKSIWQNQKGV